MYTNQKKFIGVTLRKLRKDDGFSQHQLGIESDIDIKYIGKIERGECNVSIKKLISMCEVFKISLVDFFILVDKEIKDDNLM